MQDKSNVKKALDESKKKRQGVEDKDVSGNDSEIFLEDETETKKEGIKNKPEEKNEVSERKEPKEEKFQQKEEENENSNNDYSPIFLEYLEKFYSESKNSNGIKFSTDKEFLDFFVGFLAFNNKLDTKEQAEQKHQLLELLRQSLLSANPVDKMKFAEEAKKSLSPITLKNGKIIDPISIFLENRFNYNNEKAFSRDSTQDPLHMLNTSQMEDMSKFSVIMGHFENTEEKMETLKIISEVYKANVLNRDNKEELIKFKKHKEEVEKFRKSPEFTDMKKDLSIVGDNSFLMLMVVINPLFALIYYGVKNHSLGKDPVFGGIANGIEKLKKFALDDVAGGLVYDLPDMAEDYAHENYLKDFGKSEKEIEEYKKFMLEKIENPVVRKEVEKLTRKETLQAELIEDYTSSKYSQGEETARRKFSGQRGL